MTSARDEILARIRASLADVPADDETDVPWAYGQPRRTDDLLDLFEERVRDYGATVQRVTGHLGATVVEALLAHGVTSVVLPAGLDPAVVDAIAQAGIVIRGDTPALSRATLDETDAVVTTCAVAGAVTGTIVLDHGPGQGRRALSLVPDVHVCLVAADQVVSDVPEMVARMVPATRAGRPITWISGGSATSDIELSRVEGVHGPRTLHVLLV
ncbi:MAG: lactate utilization protein C [Propionibacteriaceae bacterium]|nr:lactate utilization protein C [Micropruina sp.]HBX81062.1 lactate utilization protein C [Propionibacteriaceae bacterium]HBY24700.1 lactate utilization protein C [Propionibacteriaceae bacterium]